MQGRKGRLVCPQGGCPGGFALCIDLGSLLLSPGWGGRAPAWALLLYISLCLPCESREHDCLCGSEGQGEGS